MHTMQNHSNDPKHNDGGTNSAQAPVTFAMGLLRDPIRTAK